MGGSVYEWKISPAHCQVPRDVLAARFGKEDKTSVVTELDPILPRLSMSLKPRCGFIVCASSADKEIVTIAGNTFHTGAVIASAFRHASNAIVFAATIGGDVEKNGETFNEKGEILKSYIADVYGSESAERAAEFVHERAREEAAAKGWGAGNRYSPGYCGWDVSEQKMLFSLMPADFCGIHLTASSMMLPVKSVSGIIPAGEGVVHRAYACATCTRKGCIMRNG